MCHTLLASCSFSSTTSSPAQASPFAPRLAQPRKEQPVFGRVSKWHVIHKFHFLPRLSLFVFYLSLLGTPCAVVVFVMPFLQVRVVPPSTCGGVFGFDTKGMRYKQADRPQTQIGQIALRRIGGPIDAASEHRAGQSRNRGTVAQVNNSKENQK